MKLSEILNKAREGHFVFALKTYDDPNLMPGFPMYAGTLFTKSGFADHEKEEGDEIVMCIGKNKMTNISKLKRTLLQHNQISVYIGDVLYEGNIEIDE